jgi:hypothetical protein
MTSPEPEPEMNGRSFPHFLPVFPAFSPRISGAFWKTTNRSINHYICINQSIDQMINIQVQQSIDRSTD